MNKFKMRMMALALGLVALIGGTVATASSANAASGDYGWVLANTRIYTCAWQGCSQYAPTMYNHNIPFDCWKDSVSSPFERFFRISGNAGYIRAVQVYNQPSLPKC
jgi:hypothetical protein